MGLLWGSIDRSLLEREARFHGGMSLVHSTHTFSARTSEFDNSRVLFTWSSVRVALTNKLNRFKMCNAWVCNWRRSWFRICSCEDFTISTAWFLLLVINRLTENFFDLTASNYAVLFLAKLFLHYRTWYIFKSFIFSKTDRSFPTIAYQNTVL